MYFLTINAGSSSIKLCGFNSETLQSEFSATLSGIGHESAAFTASGILNQSYQVEAANYPDAVELIMKWITHNLEREQITAIGHRIVHGGPHLVQSCRIDDTVRAELRRLVPLDQEHLPAQILIAEQLRQVFPDVPHIACFDTAFFHTLPVEARILALPRSLEPEGIRRYGFHGLSYRYLLDEFERVAGHDAARGKIIIAHLGNGASLAAINNGEPIDTSMGLTPTGGLAMSSRSGDVDPGVFTYLAQQKGLNADQISHLLSFESGLLGISETTSDMKQLLSLEAEDQRAREAVNIFCYQVRKYIGSYAAALGGLNSLIFSGGIGEVSAPIRSRICQELAYLGIELDTERNQAQAECISKDGTTIGVHVLASNEALTIARDMKQLIRESNR